MARVAIIIPVHNRRVITLLCIEHLKNTKVLEWARIVVLDDGSSDGTETALRERFPGVEILKGNGDLWWGGAIRIGMEHAYREGAECIGWLNDDCLPDPGSLALLVDHALQTGNIAAGWAQTPSGGQYAGFRKTWRGLLPMKVPPPGSVKNCDAVAGNCVVFPRAVIDEIGLPEADKFPHALLDLDYTLSATAHGFGLDVVGSAAGRNEDNLRRCASSWLLAEQSPMNQWKFFFQPRSSYGYRANFWYNWRHWGVWGLCLYASVYLKLALICAVRGIVPLRWLRRLYAARSSAWQRQRFYENKLSNLPND